MNDTTILRASVVLCIFVLTLTVRAGTAVIPTPHESMEQEADSAENEGEELDEGEGANEISQPGDLEKTEKNIEKFTQSTKELLKELKNAKGDKTKLAEIEKKLAELKKESLKLQEKLTDTLFPDGKLRTLTEKEKAVNEALIKLNEMQIGKNGRGGIENTIKQYQREISFKEENKTIVNNNKIESTINQNAIETNNTNITIREEKLVSNPDPPKGPINPVSVASSPSIKEQSALPKQNPAVQKTTVASAHSNEERQNRTSENEVAFVPSNPSQNAQAPTLSAQMGSLRERMEPPLEATSASKPQAIESQEKKGETVIEKPPVTINYITSAPTLPELPTQPSKAEVSALATQPANQETPTRQKNSQDSASALYVEVPETNSQESSPASVPAAAEPSKKKASPKNTAAKLSDKKESENSTIVDPAVATNTKLADLINSKEALEKKYTPEARSAEPASVEAPLKNEKKDIEIKREISSEIAEELRVEKYEETKETPLAINETTSNQISDLKKLHSGETRSLLSKKTETKQKKKELSPIKAEPSVGTMTKWIHTLKTALISFLQSF